MPAKHPIKRKIENFINSVPPTAERLAVIVQGHPPQILYDVGQEAFTDKKTANEIFERCADWVDTAGRECRFVAQFLIGERVLTTTHWKLGDSPEEWSPGQTFDGSPEQVIAQLQRHNEKIMEVHLGSFKMVSQTQNDMIQQLKDMLEELQGRERQVQERERELATNDVAQLMEGMDTGRFERLIGLFQEHILPALAEKVLPPNGGETKKLG